MMNFFSSKENIQMYYDNSISEDDQKNTYALALEDAFKVAEITFSIR
nr:hypothetical protein [Johnsonella ignava]